MCEAVKGWRGTPQGICATDKWVVVWTSSHAACIFADEGRSHIRRISWSVTADSIANTEIKHKDKGAPRAQSALSVMSIPFMMGSASKDIDRMNPMQERQETPPTAQIINANVMGDMCVIQVLVTTRDGNGVAWSAIEFAGPDFLLHGTKQIKTRTKVMHLPSFIDPYVKLTPPRVFNRIVHHKRRGEESSKREIVSFDTIKRETTRTPIEDKTIFFNNDIRIGMTEEGKYKAMLLQTTGPRVEVPVEKSVADGNPFLVSGLTEETSECFLMHEVPRSPTTAQSTQEFGASFLDDCDSLRSGVALVSIKH
jgi:hypothetical protein